MRKPRTQDDVVYALCLIGSGWSVRGAAREAGMSHQTFYRLSEPQERERMVKAREDLLMAAVDPDLVCAGAGCRMSVTVDLVLCKDCRKRRPRAERCLGSGCAEPPQEAARRCATHEALARSRGQLPRGGGVPSRLRSRQRRARRGPSWSDEEDALLRTLAGTMQASEIGRRITAACGVPRTALSVYGRATALHLSLGQQDWTLEEVALQMGVLPGVNVRRRWVETGLLAAWRPETPGAHFHVRPEDVEAFIRSSPWAYDWRAIPPGRLRAVAETVNRADPWLTVREAARWLGLSDVSVQRWCERGVLPCERAYLGTSRQRAMRRIRRSDLVRAAQTIPEEQRRRTELRIARRWPQRKGVAA